MFTVIMRFYRYFQALMASPPLSDEQLKSLLSALPAEGRERFLQPNQALERKIAEAKCVRDEYHRML